MTESSYEESRKARFAELTARLRKPEVEASFVEPQVLAQVGYKAQAITDVKAGKTVYQVEARILNQKGEPQMIYGYSTVLNIDDIKQKLDNAFTTL